MTELVTVLSTGKGTWADVIKLMNNETWDKIMIVTNEFGSQHFQKKENMDLIVINANESIELIIDRLVKEFKNLTGPEVALNLISGSGKEHMAVLSALLKSGLGIRQVISTVNGIKEI